MYLYDNRKLTGRVKEPIGLDRTTVSPQAVVGQVLEDTVKSFEITQQDKGSYVQMREALGHLTGHDLVIAINNVSTH